MEQLSTLLEYQKVDMKVTKVEAKLKKSAVRQKLMRSRKYLMDSQKLLQRYDSDAGELQVGLNTIVSKYEASADTLNEIKLAIENVNEQSAIKEAEMLRRKAKEQQALLNRQEKESQLVIKKLEKMEENIKKMASNIPKIKKDYAELKKVYDEELAKVNDETAPLKKEMKDLEKQIDKKLVSRFKRIKKSHPMPVAKVKNGKCLGCNMELSSVMARKVTESNELLECENCGRMLYMEDK